MNPWFIPLILAIPLFFFWIAVHEGSHALIVILQGGKIIEFKPWPHRDEGKFYIGRITYFGKPSRWIEIAPYIMDATLTAFFLPLVIEIFVGQNLTTAIVVSTFLALPVVNTGNALKNVVQKKESDLYGNQWEMPVRSFLIIWIVETVLFIISVVSSVVLSF